jgi:nucleoside-diphosphate-sugar epimerase
MKALVTGGAGFAGRHLVERLTKDGHEVVAADLTGRSLDELCAAGADGRACDLCRDDLSAVMSGVDVIFHVAAFAAPWGAAQKFWDVNVCGAENVIKAARRAGVRRMVMVSSTSAVFDGKTPHNMADESTPYPSRFMSPYSLTKAVSERIVLAANSPDLETVVVRPHLIWGPRDKTFLMRLLKFARRGPVLLIGKGRTITDTTYVENLVEGMLLAATSEKAPGNAYFITNGEPVSYGYFINRYLEIFGHHPSRGSIPTPLAYLMGRAFDGIWSALKLQNEPPLSRYALAELTVTHTYNIEKARSELGYVPPVSNEEGFKKVAEWAAAEGMRAHSAGETGIRTDFS